MTLRSRCIRYTFEVQLKDVESLDSYQRLLDGTDDRQSDYVKQSIQRFYTEFVESIRDELY